MPLLLLLGRRDVAKLGAAAALLVLIAMAFALACVVAWLFTWQYDLYATGFSASPGPMVQAVVQAVDAGPVAQLGPGGALLPGPAGAIVPLGDFAWGSGANTFCELYAEQVTGMGNQGATAADAAQRLAGLGLLQPGLPTLPGVLVYFGPSPDNEGDGHVGIYLGGGRFRSITAYGLADAPLAGWQAPYLGWVDPRQIRSDRFGGAVSPKLGV